MTVLRKAISHYSVDIYRMIKNIVTNERYKLSFFKYICQENINLQVKVKKYTSKSQKIFIVVA